MGCARLRISAFPLIGSGPQAHRWERQAEPWATQHHTASHCWHADTTVAMSDGRLPQHSGDRSIPHFSWWPHRGGSEWVVYRFEQPRTINKVEVYWYDDRDHGGHCRVPQSWLIEWLDDSVWRPVVNAGLGGSGRDQFNQVRFDPVITKQIRLQVELQPEFSAGILELRVD